MGALEPSSGSPGGSPRSVVRVSAAALSPNPTATSSYNALDASPPSAAEASATAASCLVYITPTGSVACSVSTTAVDASSEAQSRVHASSTCVFATSAAASPSDTMSSSPFADSCLVPVSPSPPTSIAAECSAEPRTSTALAASTAAAAGSGILRSSLPHYTPLLGQLLLDGCGPSVTQTVSSTEPPQGCLRFSADERNPRQATAEAVDGKGARDGVLPLSGSPFLPACSSASASDTSRDAATAGVGTGEDNRKNCRSRTDDRSEVEEVYDASTGEEAAARLFRAEADSLDKTTTCSSEAVGPWTLPEEALLLEPESDAFGVQTTQGQDPKESRKGNSSSNRGTTAIPERYLFGNAPITGEEQEAIDKVLLEIQNMGGYTALGSDCRSEAAAASARAAAAAAAVTTATAAVYELPARKAAELKDTSRAPARSVGAEETKAVAAGSAAEADAATAAVVEAAAGAEPAAGEDGEKRGGYGSLPADGLKLLGGVGDAGEEEGQEEHFEWVEQQVLRFLYCTSFDVQKTIQLLKSSLSFRSSHLPVSLGLVLREIREEGVAYWHGRDHALRPLLVIRVESMQQLQQRKTEKDLEDDPVTRVLVFSLEFFLRAKKVRVFSSNEEWRAERSRCFARHQLEKKYGGAQPDITENWFPYRFFPGPFEPESKPEDIRWDSPAYLHREVSPLVHVGYSLHTSCAASARNISRTDGFQHCIAGEVTAGAPLQSSANGSLGLSVQHGLQQMGKECDSERGMLSGGKMIDTAASGMRLPDGRYASWLPVLDILSLPRCTADWLNTRLSTYHREFADEVAPAEGSQVANAAGVVPRDTVAVTGASPAEGVTSENQRVDDEDVQERRSNMRICDSVATDATRESTSRAFSNSDGSFVSPSLTADSIKRGTTPPSPLEEHTASHACIQEHTKQKSPRHLPRVEATTSVQQLQRKWKLEMEWMSAFLPSKQQSDTFLSPDHGPSSVTVLDPPSAPTVADSLAVSVDVSQSAAPTSQPIVDKAGLSAVEAAALVTESAAKFEETAAITEPTAQRPEAARTAETSGDSGHAFTASTALIVPGAAASENHVANDDAAAAADKRAADTAAAAMTSVATNTGSAVGSWTTEVTEAVPVNKSGANIETTAVKEMPVATAKADGATRTVFEVAKGAALAEPAPCSLQSERADACDFSRPEVGATRDASSKGGVRPVERENVACVEKEEGATEGVQKDGFTAKAIATKTAGELALEAGDDDVADSEAELCSLGSAEGVKVETRTSAKTSFKTREMAKADERCAISSSSGIWSSSSENLICGEAQQPPDKHLQQEKQVQQEKQQQMNQQQQQLLQQKQQQQEKKQQEEEFFGIEREREPAHRRNEGKIEAVEAGEIYYDVLLPQDPLSANVAAATEKQLETIAVAAAACGDKEAARISCGFTNFKPGDLLTATAVLVEEETKEQVRRKEAAETGGNASCNSPAALIFSEKANAVQSHDTNMNETTRANGKTPIVYLRKEKEKQFPLQLCELQSVEAACNSDLPSREVGDFFLVDKQQPCGSRRSSVAAAVNFCCFAEKQWLCKSALISANGSEAGMRRRRSSSSLPGRQRESSSAERLDSSEKSTSSRRNSVGENSRSSTRDLRLRSVLLPLGKTATVFALTERKAAAAGLEAAALSNKPVTEDSSPYRLAATSREHYYATSGGVTPASAGASSRSVSPCCSTEEAAATGSSGSLRGHLHPHSAATDMSSCGASEMNKRKGPGASCPAPSFRSAPSSATHLGVAGSPALAEAGSCPDFFAANASDVDVPPVLVNRSDPLYAGSAAIALSPGIIPCEVKFNASNGDAAVIPTSTTRSPRSGARAQWPKSSSYFRRYHTAGFTSGSKRLDASLVKARSRKAVIAVGERNRDVAAAGSEGRLEEETLEREEVDTEADRKEVQTGAVDTNEMQKEEVSEVNVRMEVTDARAGGRETPRLTGTNKETAGDRRKTEMLTDVKDGKEVFGGKHAKLTNSSSVGTRELQETLEGNETKTLHRGVRSDACSRAAHGAANNSSPCCFHDDTEYGGAAETGEIDPDVVRVAAAKEGKRSFFDIVGDGENPDQVVECSFSQRQRFQRGKAATAVHNTVSSPVQRGENSSCTNDSRIKPSNDRTEVRNSPGSMDSSSEVLLHKDVEWKVDAGMKNLFESRSPTTARTGGCFSPKQLFLCTKSGIAKTAAPFDTAVESAVAHSTSAVAQGCDLDDVLSQQRQKMNSRGRERSRRKATNDGSAWSGDTLSAAAACAENTNSTFSDCSTFGFRRASSAEGLTVGRAVSGPSSTSEDATEESRASVTPKENDMLQQMSEASSLLARSSHANALGVDAALNRTTPPPLGSASSSCLGLAVSDVINSTRLKAGSFDCSLISAPLLPSERSSRTGVAATAAARSNTVVPLTDLQRRERGIHTKDGSTLICSSEGSSFRSHAVADCHRASSVAPVLRRPHTLASTVEAPDSFDGSSLWLRRASDSFSCGKEGTGPSSYVLPLRSRGIKGRGKSAEEETRALTSSRRMQAAIFFRRCRRRRLSCTSAFLTPAPHNAAAAALSETAAGNEIVAAGAGSAIAAVPTAENVPAAGILVSSFSAQNARAPAAAGAYVEDDKRHQVLGGAFFLRTPAPVSRTPFKRRVVRRAVRRAFEFCIDRAPSLENSVLTPATADGTVDGPRAAGKLTVGPPAGGEPYSVATVTAARTSRFASSCDDPSSPGTAGVSGNSNSPAVFSGAHVAAEGSGKYVERNTMPTIPVATGRDTACCDGSQTREDGGAAAALVNKEGRRRINVFQKDTGFCGDGSVAFFGVTPADAGNCTAPPKVHCRGRTAATATTNAYSWGSCERKREDSLAAVLQRASGADSAAAAGCAGADTLRPGIVKTSETARHGVDSCGDAIVSNDRGTFPASGLSSVYDGDTGTRKFSTRCYPGGNGIAEATDTSGEAGGRSLAEKDLERTVAGKSLYSDLSKERLSAVSDETVASNAGHEGAVITAGANTTNRTPVPQDQVDSDSTAGAGNERQRREKERRIILTSKRHLWSRRRRYAYSVMGNSAAGHRTSLDRGDAEEQHQRHSFEKLGREEDNEATMAAGDGGAAEKTGEESSAAAGADQGQTFSVSTGVCGSRSQRREVVGPFFKPLHRRKSQASQQICESKSCSADDDTGVLHRDTENDVTPRRSHERKVASPLPDSNAAPLLENLKEAGALQKSLEHASVALTLRGGETESSVNTQKNATNMLASAATGLFVNNTSAGPMAVSMNTTMAGDIPHCSSACLSGGKIAIASTCPKPSSIDFKENRVPEAADFKEDVVKASLSGHSSRLATAVDNREGAVKAMPPDHSRPGAAAVNECTVGTLAQLEASAASTALTESIMERMLERNAAREDEEEDPAGGSLSQRAGQTRRRTKLRLLARRLLRQ